jgi:hypothetical protein
MRRNQLDQKILYLGRMVNRNAGPVIIQVFHVPAKNVEGHILSGTINSILLLVMIQVIHIRLLQMHLPINIKEQFMRLSSQVEALNYKRCIIPTKKYQIYQLNTNY